MNKKFALYIVSGLFIGALFGVSFTPVIENDALCIFANRSGSDSETIKVDGWRLKPVTRQIRR